MHATVDKPYSESCDQNRDPILEVLRFEFRDPGTVLEVGSGTGQHAVYFAAALPHLVWQPTDVADSLPGMRLWLEEAALHNVRAPLALDVTHGEWPLNEVDYVFSANTAHIMPWSSVERLFAGVGRILRPGGRFCLYGPFNYAGNYTSPSNARFDSWLKARDPDSGIRDFEKLQQQAHKASLCLTADYAMPTNNRTLVWTRSHDGNCDCQEPA